MSDERIEAKLLPKPNWAREFRLYVESAEEEARYRRIQERWDEIGPKLHERIEEFFNDPDQAFSREEDGFPLRERLTGEYYIGDAGCHHHDCDGRLGYYCSVMFRCLEKPWLADRQDRDYLGLEALIYLSLDTGEIELDEGFNTSSI